MTRREPTESAAPRRSDGFGAVRRGSGPLTAVRWRAWPGLSGPASIDGAISGVALADLEGATVAVRGAGRDCVVPVTGGRFTVDHLTPGAYRIELRLTRLVLARRLELPLGHHFVSFAVRSSLTRPRREAA
ncbi:MAG: hypothetical protein AAF721_07030 [Myxococcota bacterium]